LLKEEKNNVESNAFVGHGRAVCGGCADLDVLFLDVLRLKREALLVENFS
jgi:hypothetical protein